MWGFGSGILVRWRRRGGDMHVQNLLDHLPGARAGKAAFGGNAEIADVPARHLDAPARSLRPVLGMNEAEVKLGAAGKLQSLQRTIEIIVRPRDGDRNMKIGNR